MSTLKLCLAFCIVAVWLLEVQAGEVKVVYDTQSWPEARKACRERGLWGSCDLITKTRLAEEWSKLDLSGEKKFWVGARRFYRWLWDDGKGGTQRLFKEHGCYTLTVEKSRQREQQVNSPDQCYRDCDDKSFIYLQGKNCYCSDTLEGEAAPQDKCHLSCEGSEDKCGGEQVYFSLYSIPRQFKFQDNRKDRICASSQIRDNRFSVDSTDCKSSRQYFCESDKEASQVDSRGTSYDNSVNLCKTRYNSTLITLPSPEEAGQFLTDLQAVSDKLSASSFTTFWLPLRRHVRAVWVNGEKGEEGGEFGYCLSATPHVVSSNYSLRDLYCSHSYGYICDCSGSALTTVNPGTTGKESESSTSKVAIIAVVVCLIILLIAIAAVILIVRFRKRAA